MQQLPPTLHGFLILDKPVGISSAKAVAHVKKILSCKKIGHGGTLDPLASGILPLAIGEATKTFDYIVSTIKEYRFTVFFGEERDTDDAEGKVTASTDILPSLTQLQNVISQFTGTIQQIPPIYSALKINGQRAYKMARAGEEIILQARLVEVMQLTLLETLCADAEIENKLSPESKIRNASFSATCGKGTYVRSLGRDIARKCNSLGYISMLRRVSVGKFHENKAILLDKLPEFVHNLALFEAWVPIELALDDIPAINVSTEKQTKLRQGQFVSTTMPDGKAMALHQGRIVAIGEVKGNVFRPQRVFNLT